MDLKFKNTYEVTRLVTFEGSIPFIEKDFRTWLNGEKVTSFGSLKELLIEFITDTYDLEIYDKQDLESGTYIEDFLLEEQCALDLMYLIEPKEDEESEFLLVEIGFNWADEKDFEGYSIMTGSEYKEFVEAVKGAEYPLNICYGTNEEDTLEYPEDILNNLTVTEISEATYNARLFDSYGSVTPESILDIINQN